MPKRKELCTGGLSMPGRDGVTFEELTNLIPKDIHIFLSRPCGHGKEMEVIVPKMDRATRLQKIEDIVNKLKRESDSKTTEDEMEVGSRGDGDPVTVTIDEIRMYQTPPRLENVIVPKKIADLLRARGDCFNVFYPDTDVCDDTDKVPNIRGILRAC